MKTVLMMMAAALMLTTPAMAQKAKRKVSSAKHECADKAREQAKKLMVFHFGEDDDRISVGEEVTLRTPIKSPNGKRKYPVLEVDVGVYKASYRTRFIYGDIEGCVLIGQEILEETNL